MNEGLFVAYSGTVSSLHARVDSLEKSNTKLIEEVLSFLQCFNCILKLVVFGGFFVFLMMFPLWCPMDSRASINQATYAGMMIVFSTLCLSKQDKMEVVRPVLLPF